MTTSPALTDQPDKTPPVALPEETVEREQRLTPVKIAIWTAIALLGGASWVMIA